MPRVKRKSSSLNIYHIVLRTVNRQILFEDVFDYRQFIHILKHYRELTSFKLYAYCLMNNHVHLLIQTPNGEPPGILMQKIEDKFVRWYNKKYRRTGYLFQSRFISEPIEDQVYFLTAFRYIHQNPYNAKLEENVSSYPWSSFHAYYCLDDSTIDIDDVYSLFHSHSELIEFLKTPSHERCAEYHAAKRIPDDEALLLIQHETGFTSPSDFQHLDYETRNHYIKKIKSLGINTTQICRLTGISRTSIQKALAPY